MWQALKQFLAPPTFPDPEQTRAARWLNLALLIFIVLILIGIATLFISSSGRAIVDSFLIADLAVLVIGLGAWHLMRQGLVRIAALIFVITLFIVPTYLNVVVFQSIRSPDVIAYFALIPLVGLLLGKRSMNIFAGLCIIVIFLIFGLSMYGLTMPILHKNETSDDLIILLFGIVLNTVLLYATILRSEESAEDARLAAEALTSVNRELQASKAQLQQAHDKLEDRVKQRTQDLRLVNLSLQREIEERQHFVDALRVSEAKWRSLVENVPDIIVNIDVKGVITFINRFSGERPPETFIGEPAMKFHTQAQFQVLLQATITRVLETGETYSYESEETTERGLQWRVNRVGGIKQGKKVVALILISTDITEQKQTQAAMYQAQKLESLGVMAGGVAHDFNNLLTAMLMQLSSAATKLPLDHPASLHIQHTAKAAERATELTRQMLNYTGRNQSETKPLDLNDLITDNIHLFSASTPKNVTLDAKLQGAIPLIMGDRGQIQQLIMNLILNGADAIGQKPGLITVVTEVQAVTANDIQYWQWSGIPLAVGRYVRLEVRDTGSGMDEKTLAKIFDPFFTTKFTGRGLGLASVLGIVRSHKAGLHVASVVGQGTTFTILFPAMAEIYCPTQAAAETTPLTITNELVLVIDDEDIVRETMVDILCETGLQVLQASDGSSGIQLFRKHLHELSLVLLDLSMPGISGEAVFYELQELDPSIPVLLISGYSEHEIMERFVNKGLAGFIQKPYTIDYLLQRIQPHLQPKPYTKKFVAPAYEH
ncbi:MAG: response regulator [Caldilineaceae bacterium]